MGVGLAALPSGTKAGLAAIGTTAGVGTTVGCTSARNQGWDRGCRPDSQIFPLGPQDRDSDPPAAAAAGWCPRYPGGYSGLLRSFYACVTCFGDVSMFAWVPDGLLEIQCCSHFCMSVSA